jgi:hypothetical protein
MQNSRASNGWRYFATCYQKRLEKCGFLAKRLHAAKEILEGYFLKAQFAIPQEGISYHTPKSYVLLLTFGCWERNLSCCLTLIGSYISVREVEWA